MTMFEMLMIATWKSLWWIIPLVAGGIATAVIDSKRK